MKQNRFLIIGGDLRQHYLYQSLTQKGYHADLILYDRYDEEHKFAQRIQGADVIILPIPSTVDRIHLFAPKLGKLVRLEEITRHISPNAVLFTGGENPIFTACKTRKTVNLLADEAMTLKNAMATAEAALAILIEQTQTTLFGRNILIIGYGRIAQILADYLTHLHSRVQICARKEIARAKAMLDGCETIGFDALEPALKQADIIINTAPAPVLGRKELELVQQQTLLVDLASKPGGIDFEQANERGLTAIHALSLPGKYSPKSAAQYMEESICNTLI